WRAFWETVQTEISEGAEYREIAAEETQTVASSTIHFLFPDKPVAEISGDVENNNKSIVFTLTYGGTKVLFTADAEKELEEYLVQKYGDILDADVLKVGHHGSFSSSNQPFVDAVTPSYAMISVGAENKYHHPSPRVVRRFERAGAQVWRTDEKGDIRVSVGEGGIRVTNVTR
ncbi:MAG: MBL fold metallo-hydrolase, partial [Patescibacteria group bacterium]